MRSFQSITDKAAIGLSMLCVLHCLALPMLIVLLPSLAALPLNEEAFHLWMVVVVIPSSVYALTMGCREHKRYRLLATGLVGLSCLILAIALEELLGEVGEKVLTTLGAIIIATAHYRNFQLCRQSKACESSDHCTHS